MVRRRSPESSSRFPLIQRALALTPTVLRPQAADEVALAPAPGVNVPDDTVRAVAANLAGAKAANTDRAYRSATRIWTEWFRVHEAVSVPADPRMIATYISWLAQDPHEGLSRFDDMNASAKLRAAAVSRPKKLGTIRVHISAIVNEHMRAGFRSPRGEPAVEGVYAGIRRKLKARPHRKTPVLASALPDLICFLGSGLRRRMHKALLLVGFGAALRRSELVAIKAEHLTFTAEGLTLLIPSSKTDQDGKGESVGVPYAEKNRRLCPVLALQRWLKASGIVSGSVFRHVHGNAVDDDCVSARYVVRLLKRAITKSGRDPSEFSGHSLRAGFSTSAAKAGTPMWMIQRTTRHKSINVLADYLREADVFKDNPGKGLL